MVTTWKRYKTETIQSSLTGNRACAAYRINSDLVSVVWPLKSLQLLKTFEKSLSFANVLHTGYDLLTGENKIIQDYDDNCRNSAEGWFKVMNTFIRQTRQ